MGGRKTAKPRPATKRKPTKRPSSRRRATPNRVADLLVHPKFHELAANIRSGKVKLDETERSQRTKWSDSLIPGELMPFIEAPSIATLCSVLRAHPALYWHPLVGHQVQYLRWVMLEPRAWSEPM